MKPILSFILGLFIGGAALTLAAPTANVVRSATYAVFPSVTGGGVLQNMNTIPTAAFNIDVLAGDYVEMLWWANAATVTMPAYAETNGPPAMPGCPSAILTINHISGN